MKQQKYEKSRYIDSFHLAGFEYYDGLDIIDELKIGTKVSLVAETDNPHDADAISIYYGKTKLGYVPANHNTLLSTYLYYGYSDIFEARIQSKDLEEHPERQFRVVVKIIDNRN